MNNDLPKWLQTTLVVLLVVLALLVFLNRQRMDLYATYFRASSPAVSLRLAELSGDMDEAAVLKHFAGVPLRCVAQAPGADSLGGRVCYGNIDRADGEAAMMLATFFNQGRLVRTLVQVPWWTHGTWRKRLDAQYGQPKEAGRVSPLGGPVLRWQASNGFVEFNRDRGLDPLALSALLWSAR